MKRKEVAPSPSDYMEYSGLVGTVTVDIENDRIYGHVIGTSDKISYEASSVKELKAEFYASVDDYIEFCKQKGKEPEKSFSGNVFFRPGPEIHGIMVKAAHKCGKSVNAWLLDIVRDAVKKSSLACKS